MKTMRSEGLKYEAGRLLILDQQLLPDEERWIEVHNPREMAEHIKCLKVRGAPLIGVAAAVSLAHFAEQGASSSELAEAAQILRNSRPTAVNLMWALDRQKGSPILFETERVISVAEQIFDEDVALCDSIANHGATLVQDGENLLTHCNAGALATAGIGTAVGIIRRAHELGKKIHVFVDETRPLLQGGRLTAWELRKAGIPFTLICDNMAAGLMHAGRIQRVFVGADRIATNGDFANKIGTYGVAVLANHHKIPFHPAAPYSTVDFDCSSGKHIPIEQRAGEEVRGAAGSFGKVRWAPAGCDTYNPSFDVTPVELVTALVLDNGVFNRDELKNGALNKLKGNL